MPISKLQAIWNIIMMLYKKIRFNKIPFENGNVKKDEPSMNELEDGLEGENFY